MHYYTLNSNNEPQGPVSIKALKASLAAGDLSPESLVCQEGSKEWLPLKQFITNTFQARKVGAALKQELAFRALISTGTPIIALVISVISTVISFGLFVGVGFMLLFNIQIYESAAQAYANSSIPAPRDGSTISSPIDVIHALMWTEVAIGVILMFCFLITLFCIMFISSRFKMPFEQEGLVETRPPRLPQQ